MSASMQTLSMDTHSRPYVVQEPLDFKSCPGATRVGDQPQYDFATAQSLADPTESSKSRPSNLEVTCHSFDTVLAVIGVYQAARHNWDTRTSQDDNDLRQTLENAAGLVGAVESRYDSLDAYSRQILDFFLVIWSWKKLEIVTPPPTIIVSDGCTAQ